MSTAMFGAVPDQIPVFKSRMRRCTRTSPSNGTSVLEIFSTFKLKFVVLTKRFVNNFLNT